MERVEYTTEGNTIGLSIKYPADIRRKWSESREEIACEECEGTNITSDKHGDILAVACHDCPNHWMGSVDKVLTWHDTEEALVSLWRIPFEAV